jgi:3-methyladenine DNA glycosylase AlkD
MLRTSFTWAYVDPLAADVVGSLVERYPSVRAVLEAWGRDPDFWIQRSALLALLVPLRRGAGDFALFEKIAAPLLTEREFFIRKAIGWVLRETSKKRPDLVRDFLVRHRDRASGLTVREGAKYLAEDDRTALLKKPGG